MSVLGAGGKLRTRAHCWFRTENPAKLLRPHGAKVNQSAVLQGLQYRAIVPITYLMNLRPCGKLRKCLKAGLGGRRQQFKKVKKTKKKKLLKLLEVSRKLVAVSNS